MPLKVGKGKMGWPDGYGTSEEVARRPAAGQVAGGPDRGGFLTPAFPSASPPEKPEHGFAGRIRFVYLTPPHPIARPAQNPRPVVVPQTAKCIENYPVSETPSNRRPFRFLRRARKSALRAEQFARAVPAGTGRTATQQCSLSMY